MRVEFSQRIKAVTSVLGVALTVLVAALPSAPAHADPLSWTVDPSVVAEYPLTYPSTAVDSSLDSATAYTVGTNYWGEDAFLGITDTATGTTRDVKLTTTEGYMNEAIAVTADGRQAIVGTSKTVDLVDLTTSPPTVVRSITSITSGADVYRPWIRSVVLSPDNKVAYAIGRYGWMGVVNIDTSSEAYGEASWKITHGLHSNGGGAAISADGRFIYVPECHGHADKTGVFVVNTTDWSSVRITVLDENYGCLQDARLSADESTLFVASEVYYTLGGENGVAAIDLETEAVTFRPTGAGTQVRSIALAGDGSRLLVGMQVWGASNSSLQVRQMIASTLEFAGSPVTLATIGSHIDYGVAEISVSADGTRAFAVPSWEPKTLYQLHTGYGPAPVAEAPTISSQPSDTSKLVGETASFSVVASGSGSLSYQWQSKPSAGSWADIEGATSATYSTGSLVLGDDGVQFRVVVTNTVGAQTASTTSDAAALSVSEPVAEAPTISSQPSDRSAVVGETASFSVVASGSGSLSYQWQSKPSAGSWMDIDGATGSSHTTGALVLADDGTQFRVVVTNNEDGNAPAARTSVAVRLTVTAPEPTPTPTPSQSQATTQSQAPPQGPPTVQPAPPTSAPAADERTQQVVNGPTAARIGGRVFVVDAATASATPDRYVRKSPSTGLTSAPKVTVTKGRPVSLVVDTRTPGAQFTMQVRIGRSYRTVGTVESDGDGKLPLPVLRFGAPGTFTVALVGPAGAVGYLKVIVS